MEMGAGGVEEGGGGGAAGVHEVEVVGDEGGGIGWGGGVAGRGLEEEAGEEREAQGRPWRDSLRESLGVEGLRER